MKLVVLPPTPGTVAAYLRVSSRVQRDRETIASQREAVLEHAGGCGWTVPKERVFADDGFSGATLDRGRRWRRCATRWRAARWRRSWLGPPIG